MLEDILKMLDKLDVVHYKRTRSCISHSITFFSDNTGNVKFGLKRVFSFRSLEDALLKVEEYSRGF